MRDRLQVRQLAYPITSTIEIPGSKSHTNRALVIAALTKGSVVLHRPLDCDDTKAMISCLRVLQIQIEELPDKLIVHNDISAVDEGMYELFARDSGTTIRFLLPVLCIVPGVKIVRGSPGLHKRPIKDLVDALRQLGAIIEYLEEEGYPPLQIRSSTLEGEQVWLDPSISSQFVSALLLTSPLLQGLTIHLQGQITSAPYIDMSLQAMRKQGIEVLAAEGKYCIPSGQCYRNHPFVIEKDFSSAGYFFAIAALTQSTITLKNMDLQSSQGDKKIVEILSWMGNKIVEHKDGITVIGKGILPLILDMRDCPDQVQTMAVLAAFADGTTTILGVRSLRNKETERVIAVRQELAKMGIQTEDTQDTLIIHGGDPYPAAIDTYGDHRMAMAFAVAGTKLPGMEIRNPEVVSKTFPTFWDVLDCLGK